MYKKSIAFILFGVVVSFSFTNFALAQLQYVDSVDHYSFTLPSGWEEIPKFVIDQYVAEFVGQTQGQRIEYSAGFQLAGKDYFQYPYILVQEHDVDTPSYLQLKEVFNDFQSFAQQKPAEYSELLTDVTFEKPFIDKERNIIFMNFQINVVNVGKVNGLTAMFLGKQGVTQLNFYAVSNEYSRWLPVFNSIIDSFQYETAYAYDPVEAAKNDSSNLFDFESIVAKSLATVIIFGLLNVLFEWRSGKKKDKETS